MLRLSLGLALLASCIIPAPAGGYAPAPAYSGGSVATSEPAPAPAPAPAYSGYAQQECKSAYGTTACGYGCVAEYGQVKCASRPGGTCQAAYGQITCSEGAPAPAYGYAGPPPQQECKSEYGTTACGYGCVADYGVVKCASQPGGTCQAAYGQVTCSN
ncbi:MAG: hypothetical protein ACM31C_09895 [Acidobacteriota bacterium]